MLFFHPDYTVGIGIHCRVTDSARRLADYTAGTELHPSPKNPVKLHQPDRLTFSLYASAIICQATAPGGVILINL